MTFKYNYINRYYVKLNIDLKINTIMTFNYNFVNMYYVKVNIDQSLNISMN